jgi:hypothetical protein
MVVLFSALHLVADTAGVGGVAGGVGGLAYGKQKAAARGSLLRRVIFIIAIGGAILFGDVRTYKVS